MFIRSLVCFLVMCMMFTTHKRTRDTFLSAFVHSFMHSCVHSFFIASINKRPRPTRCTMPVFSLMPDLPHLQASARYCPLPHYCKLDLHLLVLLCLQLPLSLRMLCRPSRMTHQLMPRWYHCLSAPVLIFIVFAVKTIIAVITLLRHHPHHWNILSRVLSMRPIVENGYGHGHLDNCRPHIRIPHVTPVQ